jgi:peptide deformylase
MPIVPILKMGNPLLFIKAQNVDDPTSEEIKNIIKDMIDTMNHFHGVGLSALQIGINKRVIVYGVDNNPRYPEAQPIPLTVFINPVLKIISYNELLGLEGCLSIPNLRGEVARYQTISCSGFNEHGNFIEKSVSNFEARIIQHEHDHLNGILFPSQIQNFKRFGFEEELTKITGHSIIS